MSIEVFRIGLAVASTMADQAYGSTLAPGRWHSLRRGGPPRRLLYCASSRALAQLEKRVHANGIAPVGQALFKVTLPVDAVVDTAESLGLPTNWRDSEDASRAFGDRWLDAAGALALWVPSYVEPAESNLVINADHPSALAVQLVKERDPFQFDPRLA